MKGKGTAYEAKPAKKLDMGIGQAPHSNKDFKGKGQGAIIKTGKTIYGNCTGVADKGVV